MEDWHPQFRSRVYGTELHNYLFTDNERTITITGEQSKLPMNDAKHFMVTPLPDRFCGNTYELPFVSNNTMSAV